MIGRHQMHALTGIPIDVLTERALVGSLLQTVDPAEVVETLTQLPALQPGDFADGLARALWDAILICAQRDRSADVVSVLEECKRQGTIETVVTAVGLGQCLAVTDTIRRAPIYARDVLQSAVIREARRRLMDTAYENDPAELDSMIEAVQLEVLQRARLGDVIASDTTAELLGRIARNYELRRQGRLAGLSTGIATLDKATGGLPNVTILAARPGMGKSTLARQVAMHLGAGGHGAVLYIGLEESEEDVLERMALGRAGECYFRCRETPLQRERMEAIFAPFEKGELNVPIKHPRPASPDSIAAAIRIWAARGARVAIVDHLMQVRAGRERNESDFTFVTRAARTISAAADEAKIPLLLLHQLNREVERREDKHPVMSDLRATGELEEIGALILFCYRGNYYDKSVPANEAEIIIGKNRNGPTGTIGVEWDGPRMWFQAKHGDTSDHYGEAF